ncbi:hypothetical protein GCM10022214_37780 [Actinomadura miaoliensis]|uniref:Uncharacterized protein n=1 Tax=Actinomadura miaoliensis TaxID=430685 RepID=A0ABP7VXM4_9ACTN
MATAVPAAKRRIIWFSSVVKRTAAPSGYKPHSQSDAEKIHVVHPDLGRNGAGPAGRAPRVPGPGPRRAPAVAGEPGGQLPKSPFSDRSPTWSAGGGFTLNDLP